MTAFDFKNPDYATVFQERADRLIRLRQNPQLLQSLKIHYKHNPADFINDWGMTYDPMRAKENIPAMLPFILFEKQREWIEWVVDKWKKGEPGLTEKSRESGVSWLSVALSCTLCLFTDGLSIGFGSRKEEYVDKIGLPKSLLEKCRIYLENLPSEFLNGWYRDRRYCPHMRIIFPSTNSLISGESGDGIGRGDRQSIYFVDEAAFLERPQLIEASLSQTTQCRIDISTVHGMANPFAEKRHKGNIDVFTFHWRQDPRKDDVWYAKQLEILDPVTVAQEIDINYSASVEGVLIPNEWIQAAVDAHIKLEVDVSGIRKAGLDVADTGKDKNALSLRHGILLEHIEDWTGKESDIFATTAKAFGLCDIHGYKILDYDADGLGAGVRGDSRILNADRVGNQKITVNSFRGSAEVMHPERCMVENRTNKDFFYNLKAQCWWALRLRFLKTWRAINGSKDVKSSDIISISSTIPNINKLLSELSQPTYSFKDNGKMIVNKQPEGTKSPNLADSVMIAFAPLTTNAGFTTDAASNIVKNLFG